MTLRPAPLLAAMLLLPACSQRDTADAATAATVAAPPVEAAAAPAPCTDQSGWNDPATPLRVHGNTWYVGTCGISALLVTSPEGHVLVDAATPAAAEQIVANIRALGFDPEHVRAIVFSHEHFDHAGSLAELQQVTGAPVYARAPAVATLGRGGSDRSDPQFLVLEQFPAVPDVRIVAEDGQVQVGPLSLELVPTPGHTPGGSSWTWRSCDGDDCRQIVYADSLTAISDDEYRYSDDPGAVERFRASLARVAGLQCDILVTPHPSASALWARLGPDARQPLADADACRAYAEQASAKLDQRLASEATTPPTPDSPDDHASH